MSEHEVQKSIENAYQEDNHVPVERDELTNEALIEVLTEFDIFACKAMSAYAHKMDILDVGEGRFEGTESFMDAVQRVQAKIRIVMDRLS